MAVLRLLGPFQFYFVERRKLKTTSRELHVYCIKSDVRVMIRYAFLSSCILRARATTACTSL